MNEWNDDDLLLEVLNSTPICAGEQRDHLSGQIGQLWLVAHGMEDSLEEQGYLIAARGALQDAVRSAATPVGIDQWLRDIAAVPTFEQGELRWSRTLPPGRSGASRVVLAWAQAQREHPGRIRACANIACRRFLFDRSRSNQAKWCSMATCGNRAKARRHYDRLRAEA
ncbi:CGNR zinc finger domain-containing protein [Glaciibacter flavus]|uniref:CGNR zinc finger domain-containing protein n=1 Tax=Orlajensenia flava TaxID=2565934 RepID=UPI003AFFAF58